MHSCAQASKQATHRCAHSLLPQPPQPLRLLQRRHSGRQGRRLGRAPVGVRPFMPSMRYRQGLLRQLWHNQESHPYPAPLNRPHKDLYTSAPLQTRAPTQTVLRVSYVRSHTHAHWDTRALTAPAPRGWAGPAAVAAATCATQLALPAPQAQQRGRPRCKRCPRALFTEPSPIYGTRHLCLTVPRPARAPVKACKPTVHSVHISNPAPCLPNSPHPRNQHTHHNAETLQRNTCSRGPSHDRASRYRRLALGS